MSHDTRPVGWVAAARKVFESFPAAVRDRIGTALTIAAGGGKADIAKPLKGFGPSVMEIAVRYRTDAWRVVYVTELAGRLWVIHAFRKKSKSGIRTPKAETDLIGSRLARLRRELLP
ncbi:MAG: type II toxin-antitoxin system RelE/ParE family toxin [Rhodospirillales bacterium]|nr:type II toxin-antitoxin system RelE/ParE family toxin [Rhodospirillales bacterium]